MASPAPATYPNAVAGPGPCAPLVLVVEDDPEIRLMLVRALAAKYRVVEARDGKEGWIATARSLDLSAIVCDVAMPFLTGPELVRRLRRERSVRAPVLFLSARTDVENIVRGINCGARHYLTKPFKIGEVLAKVEAMIAKDSR